LEDSLRVFWSGFVCLLTAALAAGQANQQPTLKTRPDNQVQDLQPATDNSSLPPDAPVITVNGVCDKSDGSGADCKTVITRAEFEKVIHAVQPNMPKAQQKQFAARYVNVLLLADKAKQLGLDHGPDFEEQMYLQRLQLLARLGGEQVQKDAAKVSDSDIENYYREHTNDFRTVTYDRIYVPKQKQSDAAQKPNSPDAGKQASQTEMKEEADKLRARAVAGEDFAKLQQEAYDFAGLKLKPSTARVEKVSKNALPPNDAAIFNLNKGEVSQVFSDPQGYMIYKVEDFEQQPLADVHEQVARTLQTENLKKASESLQNTATTETTYDSSYFATPAPPTLRNPGEAPASTNPPPTTQPSGKSR
jgi:parvulin-like peptidyl-prolyl isomerase